MTSLLIGIHIYWVMTKTKSSMASNGDLLLAVSTALVPRPHFRMGPGNNTPQDPWSHVNIAKFIKEASL